MKGSIPKKRLGLAQLLAILMAFMFPVTLSGQSVDSLERELTKESLSVTEKINLHKELARRYVNNNTPRSLMLSKEGLQLAKAEGDEPAEAYFYYRLGAAYYMGAAYDSVAIPLDNALSLAEKLEDGWLATAAHEIYGRLYRREGQYTKAIDHYLEAVKISEQHKDEEGLTSVYVGIGGTYHLMKNYDQALVYYEKAEQLALKYNNRVALADIYISSADIYSRREDGREKGLHHGTEALKMAQELGNSFGEIEALQTIAQTYYLHDDFTNALRYTERAIRQLADVGNAQLLAFSLITASNIHYQQQQYDRCVETALQALETDSDNANLKVNVYANMAKSYAHLGKADLAHEYIDLSNEVLADYSNQSYQQSLSEMEVSYETEKKELKIAALEKQRELSNWLVVAGATILLVALAFAFIRFRLAVSRRKLAEEKAQRLEQEKQLVAVQATLDGESAERTRLAKDLHDGLGSMLSLVKFNLMQEKGESAVLEAVDVSRFQKALGMLDDSIQELRRVAHHMMPESLLRYGLKASLSDFCEAIPMAHFHYFGDETRLPEKLEIMIYRCIHELVNNALKHAQASDINVQLVQEEDRLSFTVQDDGVGFDAEQVTEGMGLKNVRQRVAAFQGKMSIYPSEKGTEIHVEINLSKTTETE